MHARGATASFEPRPPMLPSNRTSIEWERSVTGSSWLFADRSDRPLRLPTKCTRSCWSTSSCSTSSTLERRIPKRKTPNWRRLLRKSGATWRKISIQGSKGGPCLCSTPSGRTTRLSSARANNSQASSISCALKGFEQRPWAATLTNLLEQDGFELGPTAWGVLRHVFSMNVASVKLQFFYPISPKRAVLISLKQYDDPPPSLASRRSCARPRVESSHSRTCGRAGALRRSGPGI